MGRSSGRRVPSDTNNGSPGPGVWYASREPSLDQLNSATPFKVRLRLSAQRGHGPDADIAARTAFANPKRDERGVGRKPKGTNRWVDELRFAPAGQVVELTRTDLRNPYISRSVAVRQERHKMTVA